MDTRPYDMERRANQDPLVYHTLPADPSEDPQGDLGAAILRELLALPPGVLDRPVFRKVQGHLENYRKNYVNR